MRTRYKLNKNQSFKFYFGPNTHSRAGSIYLQDSKRNLYFTLTDMKGNVLQCISARSISKDRKKRATEATLGAMARKLLPIMRIHSLHRVVFYPLVLKRRPVFQVPLNIWDASGIKIWAVFAFLPMPHNGIRRRKKRRL